MLSGCTLLDCWVGFEVLGGFSTDRPVALDFSICRLDECAQCRLDVLATDLIGHGVEEDVEAAAFPFECGAYANQWGVGYEARVDYVSPPKGRVDYHFLITTDAGDVVLDEVKQIRLRRTQPNGRYTDPVCYNTLDIYRSLDVPERFCGDGICEPDDPCWSCPEDCPPCIGCGDGICNGSETCDSCSDDCGLCPFCGDGTCAGDENCATCSSDCGECPPVCGDGSCAGGENCASCTADCGTCPP